MGDVADMIADRIIYTSRAINVAATINSSPWWLTAKKEEFYIDTSFIENDDDVFQAIAMGLTVRVNPTAQLFIPLHVSRDRLQATDIMTKQGHDMYWNSHVGLHGWDMLPFFANFVQTNMLMPATRRAQVCHFLSSRAAAVLRKILFDEQPQQIGKRKLDVHRHVDYMLRREWMSSEAVQFKRLATPLLPNRIFTGTSEDTNYIGETLVKVIRGIFAGTGTVCHYTKKAERSAYHNEKRNRDYVTSPTLSNDWALILTATLKVRVTIWSRARDTDDVEVLNNDEIIKLLWRHEMKKYPNMLNQLDHVLMCRPNNGMLRAVRKYEPSLHNQSCWRRMWLDNQYLIPATQTQNKCMIDGEEC
jgi:hypothetical protein